MDVPGKRLFVAALGNDSVEILDAQQGKRTAEIKGLLEPQGVYYDSTSGRLYVATGGDGKLRVYDGKSLTLQDTIGFGADADNVRYDQETGDIWVGYGDGGIGIVNSTGKKAGSIVLGTHPESFKFEENGDRVYVNVPKQFGVAVIDRKKRAAVAKWGLGGSFANYPMALNEADGRLFIGCRLPARLVILDTGSGRVVTTLATVGDADDIFYDSDPKLVYVIGGEGAVEVLRQRDPTNWVPRMRACMVVTAPPDRASRVPTLYVSRHGSSMVPGIIEFMNHYTVSMQSSRPFLLLRYICFAFALKFWREKAGFERK